MTQLLVDYSKILGHQFYDTARTDRTNVIFGGVRNNINFSFTDEDNSNVDITEHVTSITIINDYENSNKTIYNIDLLTTNKLAYKIFDMYANYRDKFKFKLSIDRYIQSKDGLDISSSAYDMIPVYSKSVSSYFGRDPHLGLPLVLIDLINETPNMNDNMDINDNTTDGFGEFRHFHMSLSLISKDALNFTRNSNTIIKNATNVDDIVNTIVRKNSLYVNNLEYFIQPIDNNLTFQNIYIQDKDFQETLNILDNVYGTYIFGYIFFIEGKYLYLGDSQKSNIRDDYDLFIFVVDGVEFTSNFNSGIYFVDKDTDSKKLYVIVPEDNIRHINTAASVKEMYGENITVTYKGKTTNLLLPTSMYNDHNMDSKTIKTKNYIKDKDSVFFETRLISEYNDMKDNVSVFIDNVDSDIFNIGKHVYLHYKDPVLAKLYNGKYKLSYKKSYYNLKNKNNNYEEKLMIKMTKVVEELTYNLDDLLNNLIYINDDIETISNKVKTNSIIIDNIKNASNTFDVNMKPVHMKLFDHMYVDDFINSRFDTLPEIRLVMAVGLISDIVNFKLDIQKGGLEYIVISDDLTDYIDDLNNRLGDVGVLVSKHVVRLSDNLLTNIASKSNIIPFMGLNALYPFDVDILFIDNDPYHLKLVKIILMLKDMVSSNADIIFKDMGIYGDDISWNMLFIWWIYKKIGILDNNSRNFIINGEIVIPAEWSYSSYLFSELLKNSVVKEPLKGDHKFRRPDIYTLRDKPEDINIGDVVTFYKLDEHYVTGRISGICISNNKDKFSIYIAFPDFNHKLEVKKLFYISGVGGYIKLSGYEYVNAGNFLEEQILDQLIDNLDPDLFVG